MKPTPMIGLPVATLMILLSSTFIRLPGTLPEAQVVNGPNEVTTKFTTDAESTGTQQGALVGSAALEWKVLSIDLREDRPGTIINNIDSIQTNTSSESRRFVSATRKSMDFKHLQTPQLTLKEKLIRSRHVARR